MLIKSRLPALFNAWGLTIWPIIFIVPKQIKNLPLIAHEKVHLKEQARWLVIPWWIAYLLSRKFRLAAEVRAHRVQIDMGGCTPEQAARWLATNYWLGIDTPSALAALKRTPAETI
jgi:hypothetical protein